MTSLLTLRPGTDDAFAYREVYLSNPYRLPKSLAGKVVIDVGAHAGFFAVSVLERGAKKVYCYEPDPNNFARLVEHTKPFGGRAVCVNAAVVGAESPTDGLRLGRVLATDKPPASMTTCGSLLGSDGFDVRAVRFDDVVRAAEAENGGRPIDLVKIDCEGGEYSILYQSKVLDRVTALAGESHRRTDVGPEMCHDRLADFLRRHFPSVKSEPRGDYLGMFFATRRTRGKVKVMVNRFPFPDHKEHGDVVDWLLRTQEKILADPRIESHTFNRVCDTPTTKARNASLKWAVENGIDLVVMVDNDMAPDMYEEAPEFWDTAFDFWYTHEGPCNVAAPYCSPPPSEVVYVFRWEDNPGPGGPESNGFKLVKYPRAEAVSKTGIEEVGALATGLLMIDVAGVRDMPQPWFFYEYKDSSGIETASTEDVAATRNWSLLGVPQYVAWDCWAGHHKSYLVGKPALSDVRGVPISLRRKVLDEVRRHGVDAVERMPVSYFSSV